VRRDRPAGVVRRVDLGRQGYRCGELSVEVEVNLGEPRVVGAEPGDDDDLVDAGDLLPVDRHEGQRSVGGALDPGRAEAGHGGHRPVRHDLPRATAQSTALLELVVVAAAEGGLGVVAADHPADAGAGVFLGELRDGDQGVLCRGTATGDDDVLAHVALGRLGSGEVGDPVADPVGVLGLAGGGVAIGAQRIRCPPGPRRVDHGTSGQYFAAPGSSNVHAERHFVPADGHEPVTTLSGDADDAVPVSDVDARPRGQQLRERREVLLDPLAPGRVPGGVRAGPPALGEQLLGDRVDELCPGREQPHVSPLQNSGARRGSGLQHHRGDPAGVCLRGRSQAGRAGADDDQRVIGMALDRGGRRGGYGDGGHDGSPGLNRSWSMVTIIDARR